MSGSVRLRVVLATDSHNPSGVGEHMLTLASELFMHRVCVAFPDHTAGHSLLARATKSGHGVKTLPGTEVEIAEWLRRTDIDLLHVHAGIGWEGHGLGQAAHAVGIPVIRTEHLPYLITDSDQRRHYREAIALVDHVIAVSDTVGQTFKQQGILQEDRLSTIRNGIAKPKSTMSREAARRAFGLDKSDLVVLTVARFTPQKGHAVLLAAMEEVIESVPRVRLLLAGEGPERAGMEHVTTELGLKERVHFLGERADVPDLLAAADLFVLPSFFEGLPLVVLEAMAMGVPVVATRIGGSEEALGAAHPLYAEPHDPVSLAATTVRALTDASLRSKTAVRAKERFEAGYTASRMARKTAGIYAKISASAVTRSGESKIMQKTRIGFIGVGGIAQRHLGVLETFEDVVLAAFADPDFAKAEDAAKRFGAQAFSNHSEMLQSADLDAVYICIPPFAHGAAEREVLAHNLPFLVEKPLSLDLPLAERIASEVARKNTITAVGYHWRYLDTVDEARDRLRDNPAQLLCGHWIDSTPPPQWWWRNDRSGGQMVEQATHIIDLARYLAGDVAQVYGMTGHQPRAEFEGLDVATASSASLRFASGAIGTISATCMLKWSHRVGLHIFADGLAIELSDREIMVDVGAGRPVRHAEGDPVWREDRDFIDAVRGGENRIRCPYGEALDTHRIALAIARSAETGMPITFDAKYSEAANG